MINLMKIKRLLKPSFTMALTMILIASLSSCDPSLSIYEYDLPEANSKADETPPTANFSATQTAEDWKTYNFANLSSSATTFEWDFGDGNSTSSLDASNTYPGEGSFTVTLTASDALGVVSTFSSTIEIVEPEVPPALRPEILNGNFDDGQDNWKIDEFTGGTTSPYNSSSDGSSLNYDGTDSGSSKTPGAKWTSSTSAGPYVSNATRYAYQAITVTPNTDYIIEFSYAIKTDADDIEGGDRVIVEILDGWFDDGVDAVASSNSGPLVQIVGDTANGKGEFTTVSKAFTSNEFGKVAIWMYAITNDELYVDNVKVFPVE